MFDNVPPDLFFCNIPLRSPRWREDALAQEPFPLVCISRNRDGICYCVGTSSALVAVRVMVLFWPALRVTGMSQTRPPLVPWAEQMM